MSRLGSLVLNGASPHSVPREEGFAIVRMTLQRNRWAHLGGSLEAVWLFGAEPEV